MDGATFHERLRILLHDKGLQYVIPHPFWSPEQLSLVAQSAMETLYATLVELSNQNPIAILNRRIKTCTATAGTSAPDDLYQGIIGRKTNGQYVNFDPLPIAAASTGFDAVWISGGVFKGTANTAYYYAKPIGPTSPSATGAPAMLMAPDAFYDAVITLTAIEIIKGDARDAADRLALLQELVEGQVEALQ